MKKIILLIMLLASLSFGDITVTGPSSKDSKHYKVTITCTSPSAAATDKAYFTFYGRATRITIDVTGTDDDGTLKIYDSSGSDFPYVNYAATIFNADRDYIITGCDINSNIFGGPPIDGLSTVEIKNAGGCSEIVICIYIEK